MQRIVIVGRPNVGKSALLNRLAGRAASIVHDQPGVTRDRVRVVVERQGRPFELIDTGGIGFFDSATTTREIAHAVGRQVQAAIASADVILMVVDGLEGLRPLDEEVAAMLRKHARPTWLIINKLDLSQHDEGAAEFAQLGMSPSFEISAAHGRGIPALWDALAQQGPSAAEQPLPEKVGRFTALASHAANPVPRIAVVGRPNVGKSSLVNRLLDDERLIVSKTPGTTRDSVDLEVQFQGQPYVLTDTAGIRQKRKIHASVEMYSRHWAERSIMGSDVVLLVLDALDGPTRQDREIAGLILEHRRPCILLVNKWDLNEVRETVPTRRSEGRSVTRHLVSRSEYEKGLRAAMPFLDYAPVLFISALQGYQTVAIWQLIAQVGEARRSRFTTGVLNRIFARAQDRLQPPMRQGRRLKIYYATQKVGMSAPTFFLSINQERLWVDSYARYLMNQLRKENPLTGCPILFELREHQQRPDLEKRPASHDHPAGPRNSPHDRPRKRRGRRETPHRHGAGGVPRRRRSHRR